MLVRVFGLMLLPFLLMSCSSNKVVRVPTPLVEKSSPYELKRDWQIALNRFDYSDSEGLYFAADDTNVFFAAPSGLVVSAIKAPQSRWTDQVNWEKKFDQPVISGPTLEGEHLVIGTAKGLLMSLSKKDGSVVWQTQLSSEVLSKAVIAEGNIYVRTVDGKLSSVKASSGKINWTVEHRLPNLSLRGIAPITYEDGKIYVGWESGFVEALSAFSGERIWRAQVIIPRGRTDLERMVDIQADLVIKNNRLFVLGFHGQLVSLNPETGNLYWSKKLSGFREFLVDEKSVYVVDEDDVLSAYDVMNGTKIWRQKNYKYRNLIDLIDYDASQILLADGEGFLHWIDKIDGGLVAHNRHANPNGTGNRIARVAVEGKRLYVQDGDGFVTAYRVKPSSWYEFNQPQDPLKIMRSAKPMALVAPVEKQP